MKIYKAKDYADMSRKAANIISAQIIMKPECVLGLATGSTPVGLYKQLVEWYKKGDLDFSAVKTINLDEYKGLSQDNDQSYYYFMHDNLFNHVDINEENVHIPTVSNDHLEDDCKTYNDMLNKVTIDLQLLGIGGNGHIGFNEPGTDFNSKTHYVDLKESTIKDNARLFFNGDEDAVPKQAISMGIQNIMDAKSVVLIACGKNKEDAVKGMIEGPVTPELPASVLQNHKDVTVIIDKAAAALLEKEY